MQCLEVCKLTYLVPVQGLRADMHGVSWRFWHQRAIHVTADN